MNDYLKKKYKNVIQHIAERYIASQPIKYIGGDGKMHYNKRKLTELPHCLAIINSPYGLEKACELVFFNYEFMHSKFLCTEINEVDDDLGKFMDEEAPHTFENKTRGDAFKQLKLFEKCMDLCGNLIGDYPDCVAFQLCSRLLNFYGQFQFITKYIDECDRLSPSVCSFISPYIQQHSAGSYLVSSITKHFEPVLKTVMLGKFFITYSHRKINVYSSRKPPTLLHLFSVKLPDREKITSVISNMKYKYYKTFDNVRSSHTSKEDTSRAGADTAKTKVNLSDFVHFKVVCDLDFSSSHIEDHMDWVSNPDLFPAWFLIVNKYYMYVVAANGQVKFAYEVTSRDCEILDAFCLNMKQIVLVEKNCSSIKVFNDFERDPYKYQVRFFFFSLLNYLDFDQILQFWYFLRSISLAV
jgi:hypothetical protein